MRFITLPALALIGCIGLVSGCSWQHDGSSGASSSSATIDSSSATSSQEASRAPIFIETPKANSEIDSPLVIRGEASGIWYFEANFSIHLEDADGNEIGVAIAQAQGDWMTVDFVPFAAELTYDTSNVENDEVGTLIFRKANASGLPEHDAELRIPVRF